MRVIAGEARGRRLEALPGTDITRPTLDQVKEAMFSIVQFDLPGARVLDLYAGSGQLGIEALSRGAARCVFLDENREAVGIVMKNCKSCGVFDRSRVNIGEAARFLSACREQFDLVLLDPPFHTGTLENLLPLVDKCVEGVRADELDLTPSTHASLADLMALSAGRMGELVIDPIPNVYFTRDTFSVIGQGVSHNRMWSATRRRESIFGDFLFAYHPDYAGTPSWYSSDQPYHIEGGDILVLSAECVGIGISERTQAASIDALAKRLLWVEPDSGVRRVLAFSLPHKRSFMHLDTVFTQADVDTFTVHPGILGTLTVFELTRGARAGEVSIRQLDQTLDAILARALGLDGVRLIKCGGDDAIAAAREQWNDGSNTLAVRPGTVMVYQRNAVTNDILCREGLNLLEVPSAELSRGRGGPHCMSMAFWREDL